MNFIINQFNHNLVKRLTYMSFSSNQEFNYMTVQSAEYVVSISYEQIKLKDFFGS